MTELLRSEEQPLVSVIMPVFNAESYLSEAVESILSQTFLDLELITIDDCSTDGSLAVLKSFAERDTRVRLLENERNLGVTPTLNRGLKEAQGELIARMDADDISLPERLEKQIAFPQANPQIGLISGDAVAIDAEGAAVDEDFSLTVEPGYIKWLLHFTCPITHPAVMGRKALFEQAGGYDPEILYAEDYDLWQRMSQFAQLSNLPDVLIKKRAHAQTIGVTRRETMMHSHKLVQQRAFSRLLKRQVSLDEISALRARSQTIPPRQTLAMLREARQVFFSQNTLTAQEKRLVGRDYAFRVYRVANENRNNPACWLPLIASFFANPGLLRRVFRALGRRLGTNRAERPEQ